MTIKKITSVLALTLIATSLFTANVQAKGNQTTINFKAAIVASPCTYNINENKTNLNCFNKENNKMEASKIDFSKEKKSTEWKKLDNNNSIYQFKWTNKEKGHALLSVQHA
ncbi:pilus assembly protein [Providencia sp.]|uniref:pilus assembly protein n=1 Tax=Providencia sp. TaxID=589 RepID=UPI00333E9957